MLVELAELVPFLRTEWALKIEEAGQTVWAMAVVVSSRILLRMNCMLSISGLAERRFEKLQRRRQVRFIHGDHLLGALRFLVSIKFIMLHMGRAFC